MNTPQFDFGGKGVPLHFLHANGYPPECYQPLLELLRTQYHVSSACCCAPSGRTQIRMNSGIGIRFRRICCVSSRRPTQAPVIGVGHSLGAIVTLRAALRDPGKFRALVLIEPVLFMPTFMTRWHIIRTLGLGDKLHPLIAGAKKRRRTFDDLETVFKGYRNRKVFRYMSDESLRAYIHGMTSQNQREVMNWYIRLNGKRKSIAPTCTTLIFGVSCPNFRCQLSSCAARKRIPFWRTRQIL